MNVLFILIDDMGWRDLGCYGSSFYETPNLDRLAGQGMIFSNAYAASPVCSPARASIMSGKYPARVGVTDWIGAHTRGKVIDAPYVRQLPLEEASLATTLKQNGYATWHVGKWHLGTRDFYPDRHGFEVNVGGCSWGAPPKGYFSPWGIENLPEAPPGTYLTDHLTDQAVGLIRGHDRRRPFFLNLWHYAVHHPIQVPAKWVGKYTAKAHDMGLDKVQALVRGEPFPCEHLRHLQVLRRVVQSDPCYAAMIENLDWNVGRVLAALEETGQADNTMVIFTSDNGGLATTESSPTCNAPLAEGKGWMYEGGTREPLIVRLPGVVAPGSRCDCPVTDPDFYPTILDAAHLPPRPEQHVDGVSLLPLLRGGDKLDREAIYWHYPHYGNQGGTPGSSMRMGDYKLIEFFEDGRLELYNLRTDVGEEHNLAEQEPATVARMHGMLQNWRHDLGAKIPELNPDWR